MISLSDARPSPWEPVVLAACRTAIRRQAASIGHLALIDMEPEDVEQWMLAEVVAACRHWAKSSAEQPPLALAFTAVRRVRIRMYRAIARSRRDGRILVGDDTAAMTVVAEDETLSAQATIEAAEEQHIYVAVVATALEPLPELQQRLIRQHAAGVKPAIIATAEEGLNGSDVSKLVYRAKARAREVLRGAGIEQMNDIGRSLE